MRFRIPVAVLAFSLAAACGVDTASSVCSTDPGPEMRPGWNCLSCHREGGTAHRRAWTAAGTIYEAADSGPCEGVPDVHVVFFNPAGEEVERVTSNAAGNFFTNRPLPPGFRVGVEREGRLAMMPKPPPAGSCNACHSDPPTGDALGRIRAP
jgi:hypothetical protein